MGLEWRNTQKEGYIKLGKDKYVKKDNFDYFTELDLINRYAEKKGLLVKDVEELYRLLINYIKDTLNYNNDEEKGYYVANFGVFLKKNIFVKDLLSKKDTIKFKRAKSQLDLYMKTGKHFKIC